MRRNTKINIASAGIGLSFLLVVFDGSQLTQRAEKQNYAMAHGLSCMELVDPTVGVYDGRTEMSLLKSVEPEAARYMSADHVTVTEIDSMTCNNFLTGLNSGNPVGTNAIFLNTDRLITPAARAVAIAHELVHIQHGDPTSPLGHHWLIQHLWRTEEGEAHLAGQEVARALNAPLMYPAWQDDVVWIYPLPLSYLFFAIVAAWILFTKSEPASPKAKRQSYSAATRRGYRPA